MIDPLEVKQAIKDGQLKIYIKENRYYHRLCVYLADVLPNGEQGDTAMIYEIPEPNRQRSWRSGCDRCEYVLFCPNACSETAHLCNKYGKRDVR